MPVSTYDLNGRPAAGQPIDSWKNRAVNGTVPAVGVEPDPFRLATDAITRTRSGRISAARGPEGRTTGKAMLFIRLHR